MLIGQRKIWNFLTYLRSRLITVILCLNKVEPFFGCNVRSARTEPPDNIVQD